MLAIGALLWIRLFFTTVTMEMVICGFALVEVNLVLTRKLFMIKTILVLPSRSALLEWGQGAESLTVKMSLILAARPAVVKMILALPLRPSVLVQGQGAGLLTVKTILVLPSPLALLERGQGAGLLTVKVKTILVFPSQLALLERGRGAEPLMVKAIMTLTREPTIITEILMLNLGLSLILFSVGGMDYSLRKVQVVGQCDSLRALVLIILLQFIIFMS